jgi:phenylalanyl-tRNA synthetase alpha chain
MRQELGKIKKNFESKLAKANNFSDLKQIKKDFLGRKGALKKILKLLKNLDKKERQVIGKKANDLRNYINASLREKQKKYSKNEKPLGERIDASLPGKKLPQGHVHPLTHTLKSIERVFESMGFTVFLTPEVETEFYNFDSLNIPANHPAREMWDTFWLPNDIRKSQQEKANDRLLLRTHNTAMQHHYMKNNNPPFRIITPGKCFRYEASDNSHDIQFYQVDGLVVDKNISISNFKAIIEQFLKKLFARDIQVRIRPGYFPFVEPGFEIDIAYQESQGTHRSAGKEINWLEIMGAGMVHPKVFKQAGYNPQHWQGFAFGMGVDRLAMLKYGIDDVRLFYQNDLRFLEQF